MSSTYETRRRAAALLEAVARYGEDACDPEVPIRCGHAADLLGGSRPWPIPDLPDNRDDLRAAIEQSLTLLGTLSLGDMPEADQAAVGDAAHEARAAHAAIG